ncbi:hypothetical protein CAPN006_21500 [Capnocytophaga canimorsus]|uniref:RHS repeat-associated core domain-containing protein n=1 Tax=Capnocytophaga canimorsus TaxID=28188 RepID=UPI001AD2055F|nr:RHS repeat-associated core domain-containing protein [Capnocytophaga canimorsus]GIM57758.1 hypothetical protein CAPN006_21500 [Capnocytophaga canimorsus]
MCFRCVVEIKRYLWDGNVLLHEWEYDVADEPQLVTSEIGEVSFNKPEPINNLITWVYENGSFVPIGKLTQNESFSIVSDYLGTPVQAFNEQGELVWERELDIYGRVRKEKGISNFVPFRYQGQYYDSEVDLCYNRFRYYDCNTGTYISQDPIGLLGNNPNFYAYVFDSNTQVDVFGLDIITVFRFDQRKPSEIKSGGGFKARKPGANIDLYDYALNNTKSQYISTTYSLNSAIDFGNNYYGGKGYIYKIEIDDSKGINVNKALGNISPFSEENEFAVIDKIKNKDIKGYANLEDITDSNNVKWKCY